MNKKTDNFDNLLPESTGLTKINHSHSNLNDQNANEESSEYYKIPLYIPVKKLSSPYLNFNKPVNNIKLR